MNFGCLPPRGERSRPFLTTAPLHACAVGTVPRTVRKAARSGTAPYSLSPIACLLLSTIHYKPSTIFPLVARRSLLVAILYPPSTINHPLFFPSRPGPFFFFSLNLNYLKLKSFLLSPLAHLTERLETVPYSLHCMLVM